MKTCSICKEEKNLSEFNYSKSNKDGLRSYCKNCVKEYNQKYRSIHRAEKIKYDKEYGVRNRDRIKKQHAEYYASHRVVFKEKSKKYRDNNKGKIKGQRRKSRGKNRDKIRRQKIDYYLRNKDRIVKKSVENRKALRERDPSRRALDSCRARIRVFIKSLNPRNENKITKSANTLKLLGCSESNLKTYLESKFKPGMTWDNYGLHGWHIDHIQACSSFSGFDKIKTQKECFNYKNLQPLWAGENLSKGAK